MTRTGWHSVGRCAPALLGGLLALSACAQGATQSAGERDSGAASGVKGGSEASATTGGSGGQSGASPSGTGSFGNAPTPPPPVMPTDAGMSTMGGTDAGTDAGGGTVDAGGPPGDVGTCTDKTKNGKETDVDCGGGDCPKCGAMDTCTADGDCDTGVCNATNTCCAPKKVADCTATQCGMIADGCGGTVTCPNNCAGGVCSGGTCCMARTASSCTATECGSVPNGCGGTISCPNNCAASGKVCQSNACVMQCSIATCPSCGIGDLIYQKCCRSDERCGCEWTVFGGCSLP